MVKSSNCVRSYSKWGVVWRVTVWALGSQSDTTDFEVETEAAARKFFRKRRLEGHTVQIRRIQVGPLEFGIPTKRHQMEWRHKCEAFDVEMAELLAS